MTALRGTRRLIREWIGSRDQPGTRGVSGWLRVLAGWPGRLEAAADQDADYGSDHDAKQPGLPIR
jgi:hypothetical protein